ncbi:MAG: hypothetical protein RL497_1895 [Pseudomonadota bacterium]
MPWEAAYTYGVTRKPNKKPHSKNPCIYKNYRE